jgi:hypothetical protein
MGEMWKVIPGVNTPLALLAFLIAALLVGYGIHRRKRYAALEGVTDPETRLQMLRALLGQYTPDMSNLTREQKAAIINEQVRQGLVKFRWVITVGVVIILATLATICVIALSQQRPPHPEQQNSSSLILRIENAYPDVAQAGAPPIQEPLADIARRIEFTLSNPLSGLAIIDELALEVLDVIEDRTGSAEAVVVCYRYAVDLDPTKRGGVRFGDKFKYAPGEVDRFSLGVRSDTGYDYFVRVVVRWYDAAASERRETTSEPLVLRFPAPLTVTTPGPERERLQQRQEARIEERLRQLRGR